jgi:hypothetical protein
MSRSKYGAMILAGLILAALATAPAAWADDDNSNRSAGRTDFALFDGTNAADPDAGVSCGARQGNKAIPFTIYVAVSNWSPDTAVLRVTYADGDVARFQIPANSSFSFVQAAGSTKNVDDLLVITSETEGALAGSVSISTSASAKKHPTLSSFCVTV